MELDARTLVDGTTVDADLCIIGAGPVGEALADALRDSGLQVAIIESGSRADDPEIGDLNSGDSVGDRYGVLRDTRSRGVGGTATRWNTGVGGAQGAKFLPLDAIDFERRRWMAWSGWPFDRDYLNKYYSAAHATCGLGPFDYSTERWSGGDHRMLDLGGSGLIAGVYQYGRAAPFREAIPSRMAASSAIQLVHGATITALVRGAGKGRIAAARWSSLPGTGGVIRAKRFVLAAGAIENARLLLLFARAGGRMPGGVDWLGRGFMEHPIDSTLELVSRESVLQGEGSFYQPHAAEGTPAVMGRIALAPALLRELQLPNASVRMLDAEEPPILRRSAVRSAARRLVPMQGARRAIGNSIRGIAGLANRFRGARYRLLIDLEQLPHRDNRVVLSDSVDRLGQPRAELHWRWRPDDEGHRVRIRDTVARELQRAGVGRTTIDVGRPLDPCAHHHAGTTRMHADPAEGVVDETLRVHGEENLYAVGSSVFPTAGVANPTLTAIALALRLAEHLAPHE